jgi:hypothetical protein
VSLLCLFWTAVSPFAGCIFCKQTLIVERLSRVPPFIVEQGASRMARHLLADEILQVFVRKLAGKKLQGGDFLPRALPIRPQAL